MFTTNVPRGNTMPRGARILAATTWSVPYRSIAPTAAAPPTSSHSIRARPHRAPYRVPPRPGARDRAIRRSCAELDQVDVVHHGRALGDQVVQLRQERGDPFGGVDDDDDQREVLRQGQQPGSVDVLGAAEAFPAPERAGARHAGAGGSLDDLRGQRVVRALARSDSPT